MKTKHIVHWPPRKILAALDFSDASLAAWRQAGALGRRFDAKVEGLYVQPWLFTALGMGVADPALTEAASRRALQDFRARLGAHADVKVVPGDPEETILSWGREASFDLIVMGTHGRRGLERAMNGSVAETIVRYATIPVLIARGQAPSHWRSVLAPVNFEPYSTQGLRMAAMTAETLGARLTLLHVLDTPLYGDPGTMASARALLADAAKKLPDAFREACRPKTQLALGNAAEEIVRAADSFDLTVLVAHRKHFLSDTILGTTAERVLRHATKPVLAIPSGLPPLRRTLPARLEEAIPAV